MKSLVDQLYVYRVLQICEALFEVFKRLSGFYLSGFYLKEFAGHKDMISTPMFGDR